MTQQEVDKRFKEIYKETGGILEFYSEKNSERLIDLIHEARRLGANIENVNTRKICVKNINETLEKQVSAFNDAKKKDKEYEYNYMLQNFRQDVCLCSDVNDLEEDTSDGNE